MPAQGAALGFEPTQAAAVARRASTKSAHCRDRHRSAPRLERRPPCGVHPRACPGTSPNALPTSPALCAKRPRRRVVVTLRHFLAHDPAPWRREATTYASPGAQPWVSSPHKPQRSRARASTKSAHCRDRHRSAQDSNAVRRATSIHEPVPAHRPTLCPLLPLCTPERPRRRVVVTLRHFLAHDPAPWRREATTYASPGAQPWVSSPHRPQRSRARASTKSAHCRDRHRSAPRLERRPPCGVHPRACPGASPNALPTSPALYARATTSYDRLPACRVAVSAPATNPPFHFPALCARAAMGYGVLRPISRIMGAHDLN